MIRGAEEKNFQILQIERLQNLKNITLKELCAKSGLAYATLHGQLTNNRKIPFETIDVLAKTFDVGLDYFSKRTSFQGKPIIELEKSVGEVKVILDRAFQEVTERGTRPTTDEFLDSIKVLGFDYDRLKWVSEYLDVFVRPGKNSSTLTNLKIGKKSLFDIPHQPPTLYVPSAMFIPGIRKLAK